MTEDDLTETILRSQRIRNNGRTDKEVIADQNAAIRRWVEENLDYVLSTSSVSDDDLVALNPEVYERSLRNMQNVPDRARPGQTAHLRLNALNFLTLVINALTFYQAPETLLAIDRDTNISETAFGCFERMFRKLPTRHPDEQLRRVVIHEWIGIAQKDCDLSELLKTCCELRTSGCAFAANSPVSELYMLKPRAVSSGNHRWAYRYAASMRLGSGAHRWLIPSIRIH